MKMLLCVLIYFSHVYPLFHHEDGPACIIPVRKVGGGVNEVAFLGGETLRVFERRERFSRQ